MSAPLDARRALGLAAGGAGALALWLAPPAAIAAPAAYAAAPIQLGSISAPPAPAVCQGRSGWYCRPAGGAGAAGGSGTAPSPSPSPAPPPAVPAPAPAPSPQAPSPPTALSAAEGRLVALMNAARTSAGLGPLAVNPALENLARKKAADMVRLGYVGHLSPDLGWPIQMEIQAGYMAWSMGAEDIAEAGSVLQAFAMFRASPTHWANIVDPALTQVGVAVVPVPYGVLVEVLFSGPPF
ncbi:MAG: CAP domain-containing protein [Firmicutes bacterium]|nr:CAP domain-containing protein [Bacillota bacterium]